LECPHKALIALACVASAIAMLHFASAGSPQNIPVVLAVLFTVIVLAYDLKYMDAPKWIFVAMFVAGGLFSVLYYFRIIPPTREVAAALNTPKWFVDITPFSVAAATGLTAFPPLSLLIVGVFAWFLAYFVALPVGAGGGDMYFMMGLAALIPLRAIPNMGDGMFGPGSAMLFITSVMLNSAVFGMPFAYVLGRILKVYKTDAYALVYSASEEMGETWHPRPFMYTCQAVLSVALWLAVAKVLPLLTCGLELSKLAWVWFGVCVAPIALALYLDNALIGAIGGVVMTTLLPREMPIPRGIIMTSMLYITFVWSVIIIIECVAYIADEVYARARKVPAMRVYPYVPAILIGLIVTLAYGDFILGWLVPNVSSGWVFAG
jgi:hypothetical protein